MSNASISSTAEALALFFDIEKIPKVIKISDDVSLTFTFKKVNVIKSGEVRGMFISDSGIKYCRGPPELEFAFNVIVNASLNVTSTVALGLAVNWIYDKFKEYSKKGYIKINGVKITKQNFNKKTIKLVLTNKIKRKNNNKKKTKQVKKTKQNK
jgi:hypothetical protein